MKVIKYFNDIHDEQITIADLCNNMEEFLDGGTPCMEKYMGMKLEGHFGEDIIIT